MNFLQDIFMKLLKWVEFWTHDKRLSSPTLQIKTMVGSEATENEHYS